MILKVDTITGEIVMAGLETYQITPMSPTIQIIEEGVEKFQPNQIKTYIIDGETARNYEDPRKPEYNIHACKIVLHPTQKNAFSLHDDKNKIIHHFKKDSRNIGIRYKIEYK